ncbi:MAG: zinc-binding dehydrogenase [Coriobacteriia bacterium]|nr:zinc-binding dehydrogenase [Coriobacteriia bacterium]MBS5478256.1 zinc-binding dehydrogenase [Coriobacteriia bacterium]
MPEGMPLEEAAALPSASVTAYAALSKVGASAGADTLPELAGKRLLVCGASGGVGQYAVLLAIALGAEVTAACSARNFEIARACGAKCTVDYGGGVLKGVPDGMADAAIGVNGRTPAREFARVLRPGGTFVLLGTSLASPGVLTLPLRGKRLKVALFFSQIGKGVLPRVVRAMASSGLHPGLQVLDGLGAAMRGLPDIVRDHPRGKVVIRV